jgi:TonB family protein
MLIQSSLLIPCRDLFIAMTILAEPVKPAKSLRHHSDPPFLWVLVLSGSLLINVFLLAGLRHWLSQAEQRAANPGAIAVEFYTPPPDSSTNSVTANSVTAAGKTPANLSKVSSPAPKSPLPSAQQPAQPVSSTILATTSDLKAATAPRQPQKNREKPRSITTAASQTQPSPAQPSPSSTPNSSQTSPASPTEPTQSGIALNPLPIVPNAQSNNPGEDKRWQQPVKPFMDNPAIPGEFIAQISPIKVTPVMLEKEAADHEPVEADLSQFPATIKGKAAKTLASDPSTCMLNRTAMDSFGKSVVLRVAIDDKGQPIQQSSISVQKPSGNDSYDKLAICALKTWSFNPAYEVSHTTRAPLYRSSFLDIEITISQS